MNEDIIMILFNCRKFEDELDTIPHRQFMDLCLYYFVMRQSGSSSRHRTLSILDNEEAKRRGLEDGDMLFGTAAVNTMKMLPLATHEWGDSMHVLTNNQNVFGATALLYPEGLAGISEKTGGDLLIIPSSIHEVICVPADDADPEVLRSMLVEANNEIVPEESVLSDSIYYYDSEKQKVDKIVAGSGFVQ